MNRLFRPLFAASSKIIIIYFFYLKKNVLLTSWNTVFGILEGNPSQRRPAPAGGGDAWFSALSAWILWPFVSGESSVINSLKTVWPFRDDNQRRADVGSVLEFSNILSSPQEGNMRCNGTTKYTGFAQVLLMNMTIEICRRCWRGLKLGSHSIKRSPAYV